jgi:hypothetical protein
MMNVTADGVVPVPKGAPCPPGPAPVVELDAGSQKVSVVQQRGAHTSVTNIGGGGKFECSLVRV